MIKIIESYIIMDIIIVTLKQGGKYDERKS